MNFYPTFNKGQILKQNMLETLRDFPREVLNVLFLDYDDGIICGFKSEIDNETRSISVMPGIIKLNGKLAFLTEPKKINVSNGKNFIYIDVIEEDCADGKEMKINFQNLSEEMPSKFEYVRFVSEKTTPLGVCKDFFNISRVETYNLIFSYSKKSVSGGSILRDEILEFYAREVLSISKRESEDTTFAYLCLNGIFSKAVFDEYLKSLKSSSKDEIEILKEHLRILRNGSKQGTKTNFSQHSEKKMIVDW